MIFADYTAPEGASPLAKRKTCIKNKLVQGVGINDFPAPIKVNGRDIKSYNLWKSVLQRCYSVDCQMKHPTYIGCSVVKEWHSFSRFERWFTENYIDGYHLDKDILVPGNKVYSAGTCVFVSREINGLLTDCRAARGAYPLGVNFHKVNKRYIASIHTESVLRYLGSFSTALEAHQAWQLAKSVNIDAAETNNPRIRAALDKRAAQLRDDHANGRITVKL